MSQDNDKIKYLNISGSTKFQEILLYIDSSSTKEQQNFCNKHKSLCEKVSAFIAKINEEMQIVIYKDRMTRATLRMPEGSTWTEKQEAVKLIESFEETNTPLFLMMD